MKDPAFAFIYNGAVLVIFSIIYGYVTSSKTGFNTTPATVLEAITDMTSMLAAMVGITLITIGEYLNQRKR